MSSTAPRLAAKVELALDARAHLGEGPSWSAARKTLYWVDILGGMAHAFVPATGATQTWRIHGLTGCLVERAAGGLLLGYQHGFAALDPATGRLEPWIHPEPNERRNRVNDGKVDSRGRLYAGTKSEASPVTGGLYRLDPDRRLTKLLDGVGCSNGLAWSADGRTFYYIDTVRENLRAFPCDPATGALGEGSVVVDIPAREHGWPDGMCIDAEGMLWVAHYGGGKLTRWDPRARRLIGSLSVPAPNVTSCAFGGERLDQLYITTARAGMNEEALTAQMHAGGVFVAQVGVVGTPTTPFAG